MIYIVSKYSDDIDKEINIGVFTEESKAFIWAWLQAFQYCCQCYVEVWNLESNNLHKKIMIDFINLEQSYVSEILIDLIKSLEKNSFPDKLKEFMIEE